MDTTITLDMPGRRASAFEPPSRARFTVRDTIHRAAEAGDEVSVKRLLREDPSLVHARDRYGMTALHWAATADVARRLVINGAKTNVRADYGSSPLHKAAARGLREVVAFLVASGADRNAKDQVSRTPLHLAAAAGHYEVVEWLLGKAAYPGYKDQCGNTPLDTAARHGHTQIVDLLQRYHT
jgi:ankyrin repeat protein